MRINSYSPSQNQTSFNANIIEKRLPVSFGPYKNELTSRLNVLFENSPYKIYVSAPKNQKIALYSNIGKGHAYTKIDIKDLRKPNALANLAEKHFLNTKQAVVAQLDEACSDIFVPNGRRPNI